MKIVFWYSKCIIDFALFYWLSIQFFSKRFEKSAINNSIIIMLATMLYFVNMLDSAIYNTVMSIFCSLIINYLLTKGRFAARLICSISEVLLIVACEFIPITILSLVNNERIMPIWNTTIIDAASGLISSGLFCIIVFLVRYIVCKKNKYSNTYGISQNIQLIIVPIVSLIIVYYILDVSAVIEDVSSPLNLWSLIIYIGILIINIVVIIDDNNMKKSYQMQLEINNLKQLKGLNDIVIRQQDQYIQDLKGFAHDYKKQMEGIKEILAQRNSDVQIDEEMQQYIDEMLYNIKDSHKLAFIPTPALRSIVSQAEVRCNSLDIELLIDIQYANFYFVSFPDIYTLFQNPIDNAITACSLVDGPKKKIELRIIRKKNMVYIEIMNTKSNEIYEKSGKFSTTKTQSKNHGFGIKNLKKIVKKYDGYLEISYSDDMFSVIITMPVPANNSQSVQHEVLKVT